MAIQVGSLIWKSWRRGAESARRRAGVPAARVVISAEAWSAITREDRRRQGAHVTIIDNTWAAFASWTTLPLEDSHARLLCLHDPRCHLAGGLSVGAVLVPGAAASSAGDTRHAQGRAGRRGDRDVAVDQGGAIETTHPTTHSDPTILSRKRGTSLLASANMTRRSPTHLDLAATNATLPYALKLANKGFSSPRSRERIRASGRRQYLTPVRLL